MEQITDNKNQISILQTKLENTKAELRDLATMGTVITAIHEINAVLSVVMDMAVRLVHGEVGLIMLEENGELKNKISWGVSEKFAKTLMYRDNIDLPTYCFKNQEAVILSDLGIKSEDGIRIDSMICLPIKNTDKCFGVVLIINKDDGTSYGEEDEEILQMLMNFVAVAIDNSLMVKDKLKQQKTQQEMAVAKQVQETILPQNIDNIKGVEIGAIYFPAREVGGDFYDVIKLNETQFIVIIGDVSNKSVPAALVMSAAAAIIKSTLVSQPNISLSKLAETTNNLLASEIIKDREMFVTLFFSKFDLNKRLLSYCNAGHLPGLFWKSSEKNIIELSEGGPIIGQFPGIQFDEGKYQLENGDRLFLFTDGLTEAADSNNQLFGRERAEQVFSVEIGLPPKEFCYKVKSWVDRFTVGCAEETVDDFTILQVKVK